MPLMPALDDAKNAVKSCIIELVTALVTALITPLSTALFTASELSPAAYSFIIEQPRGVNGSISKNQIGARASESGKAFQEAGVVI